MTLLRELNIPRMGSVENAKLVVWRVAEGAAFAAGAVLCDVETDKTLTEVEVRNRRHPRRTARSRGRRPQGRRPDRADCRACRAR